MPVAYRVKSTQHSMFDYQEGVDEQHIYLNR